MKNKNYSENERLYNLLENNPQQVYSSMNWYNFYNSYYYNKMKINKVPQYLSKLWKDKKVLRTKSQLNEGDYYSKENREELDNIYKNHLLPYEYLDKNLIDLIKNNNFIKLKNSELISDKVFSSKFLSKYDEKYLINKKVYLYLAKLVAFVMGDGHIRKNKQTLYFFFRHVIDADKFRNEFKSIFYKDNISINKREYCYETVICSKYLASLLIKLGAPIGSKITQSFLIPEWIYNGPDNIKKGFLSTIYGNEGSKPQNNRWRIQFVLSKDKKNIEGLLIFLNQIRTMLNHFGFNSSHIQLRKQKGRNYYGRFYIKGKENIHKFYNLFEFYCASEKQKYLEQIIKTEKVCVKCNMR